MPRQAGAQNITEPKRAAPSDGHRRDCHPQGEFEHVKQRIAAFSRIVMMVALAPALHVAPAHAMGRLPVRVDTVHGRVLLTLAPPSKHGTDGRYLYATSRQAGLGSAAIMLDRGPDGRRQLLEFRRIGTHGAIAFENTRFCAVGGSPAVRAGVSESFSIDVVWMVRPVTIKPDGSVVIDIASF